MTVLRRVESINVRLRGLSAKSQGVATEGTEITENFQRRNGLLISVISVFSVATLFFHPDVACYTAPMHEWFFGYDMFHWVETWSHPALDFFFRVITDLGSSILYFLIIAPLFWVVD